MSVQFRKIHGGTIFFKATAIETTYISTLQSILSAYEMKNNCSLFRFSKKIIMTFSILEYLFSF